ncbi:MAG: hypothetical protein V3U84_06710 [Thiotrichaceae bacterium]
MGWMIVLVYDDGKRGLLFSGSALVADDLLEEIALLIEQMETC